MKQFSASDAAFSGFRLLREHPKTFAVWAVVLSALSLVIDLSAIKLGGSDLALVRQWTLKDSPDPAEVGTVMSHLMPFMIVSLGYYLLLYSILLAGLNRVILRPAEAGGLARLKLGAAELRQGAAILLTYLILMGVYLAVTLVLALAVGILLAIGGGGEAAATGLTLLIMLIAGCVQLYVGVRLSFAGPMTFAVGKVTVLKSWSLTQGRVLPLFGAYFVAMVLAITVNLLIFVILATLAVIVTGDLAAANQVFKPDLSSMAAYFSPAGMLRALFAGVPGVMTLLILFGPAPTIYRELYGDGSAPDA